MGDGGNPFLLPGAGAGAGTGTGAATGTGERSEPPLESGTRKVPRLDPDPPPPDAPAPVTVLGTPLPPTGASVATGWRLVLPGGAEVLLDRPVLLGRDPVAPEGVRGAHPIAVRDPEKTVSKTHALLTPEPGGVRVRDLHSTNGTTLVLQAGRAPVPADGDVLVARPADLLLGRFAVRIEA